MLREEITIPSIADVERSKEGPVLESNLNRFRSQFIDESENSQDIQKATASTSDPELQPINSANQVETVSVNCHSTSLLVNSSRQRNNPVLTHLRNTRYEWSDRLEADFDLGSSALCLYLSLKWHRVHPRYIEQRVARVGANGVLRVLLVVVDVHQPRQLLLDLDMFCFRTHWTLVVGQSVDEAADYLESFKQTERRAADIVAELTRKALKPLSRPVVGVDLEGDDGQQCLQAVHFLASVRSISRTDAQRLIGTFGSLSNIALASVHQLSLCPGLGPQKANRLYQVFREPFLR